MKNNQPSSKNGGTND